MKKLLITATTLLFCGCNTTIVSAPKSVSVEIGRDGEVKSELTGSDLTGARGETSADGNNPTLDVTP